MDNTSSMYLYVKLNSGANWFFSPVNRCRKNPPCIGTKRCQLERQFVPIGMPTVCSKIFTSKTTKVLSTCLNYIIFPFVLYTPPLSFEAVYCFICGHRRVDVARYRMILSCSFLITILVNEGVSYMHVHLSTEISIASLPLKRCAYILIKKKCFSEDFVSYMAINDIVIEELLTLL